MMATKRYLDLLGSAIGLVLVGPFLVVILLVVYAQDRHSPIYAAVRVGRYGKPFRMHKVRSMVVNAEKLGGSSSGSNDPRITRLGRIVRKYKLDEFPQLWHVLVGDMSLVGPRPNTVEDVKLYTPVERQLLDVRPGLTDLSSIVFSDEGEILRDCDDPDLAYNQLIRPGKSMLGLFYTEHCSLWLDIRLCFVTAIAILSREWALARIQKILSDLGAPKELRQIASRAAPLVPMPPPGADRIVTLPYSRTS